MSETISNKKVRVRFAPSPTGPLHIGGVRTALFNYLFAKQNDGVFILRIEDTDSARFVQGAEEYIIESLNWLGLNFDEGVGVGGNFAPYRQSERKNLYFKYAEQLVNSGNAYYAFDSSDELDNMRKQYEAQGKSFIYNHSIREQMQTSLVMSDEELQKRLQEEKRWVIRFKIPPHEEVTMYDIIRGEIKVNTDTLDDKVLFKSIDMLPTYHLANIVDDRLMEISHVIRGEEWLPSLPLHVLLYRAFGWDCPEFAHLSLLLKPDGKGKLSKRDGDRLGFPVFPLEWKNAEGEISSGYREAGYFPEAVVNLLALLGWNPGTEQEIFSIDELIKNFSLERVIKSGAKFNPEKTRWFNQQYIRQKSNEDLASLYQPILKSKGINASDSYVATVCGLVKERATFVSDFWDLSSYFFVAPEAYDEKATKKYWSNETSHHLQKIMEIIDSEPFDIEKIQQAVHTWISDNGLKTGNIMNAFRICIVGAATGVNMFDIISLTGKDETIKRIKKALNVLLLTDNG
ncbi:MAG: glutamate--tRNA ligase [Prevotellaceae bacterium]|jgi:glutamyl-tRNA synthetase|nr:glutamate--tRNA ligase [Prevotellaceae bacterium]